MNEFIKKNEEHLRDLFKSGKEGADLAIQICKSNGVDRIVAQSYFCDKIKINSCSMDDSCIFAPWGISQSQITPDPHSLGVVYVDLWLASNNGRFYFTQTLIDADSLDLIWVFERVPHVGVKAKQAMPENAFLIFKSSTLATLRGVKIQREGKKLIVRQQNE